MADYIPVSDADFNVWINNFVSALDARKTALGVNEAEIAALRATRETWETALSNHNVAQANAATAARAKQQARESLVRTLRSLAQRAQTHPNTQDSDRVALGLSLRPSTYTRAPAPATRPVARIDTGQRLRHTIHFGDETTPTRRAKPPGVRACEIWVKVGDPPPAGPSELTFLDVATATPRVFEHAGADAGKVAHYMLRWVNSRGQKGPWSLTVSATIPG